MSAPEPLYRRIAADLRADIANARFAAGDILPTEHALAARYAVSRHTARMALQMLLQDGLVARKRGIGTIVVNGKSTERFVQSISSLAGLLQYARDARLTVSAISQTRKADLALLGAASLADWRCITGLRRTSPTAAPLALTRIFVLATVCPSRTDLEAHTGALHEWIAQRFGVTVSRVEQEIEAITLTQDAARRLAADPGDAALQIVRRYFDARGGLFQLSQSVHPGARFTYRMQVDRG
jgi:DNA-binding GntR family transcriptional regulator